ncbi:uncharacterized protein N7484_008672 [Penicillium longicatenatum]|uniref:uncharacterized protein n=1 Tax=Penicillium longicatenatum TaxID=1561947 RepID=UPI0025475057|nr:uncharacterized protein N7484_008672 [Penicillium longicatenatum]KAJ5635359.1 hypothetical protein N7484_008672 [Penicillium longicatenatum]
MQEELTKLKKEAEDLRAEQADLEAQMGAYRELIQRAREHCRTALNKPKFANPLFSTEEMAIRKDEYDRNLSGPWLLEMESRIGEMQETFGLLIDKAREIMARLNALIKS